MEQVDICEWFSGKYIARFVVLCPKMVDMVLRIHFLYKGPSLIYLIAFFNSVLFFLGLAVLLAFFCSSLAPLSDFSYRCSLSSVLCLSRPYLQGQRQPQSPSTQLDASNQGASQGEREGKGQSTYLQWRSPPTRTRRGPTPPCHTAQAVNFRVPGREGQIRDQSGRARGNPRVRLWAGGIPFAWRQAHRQACHHVGPTKRVR